jgi:exopolysaccharide biosynthesis polyprenyl glycosylphosphotransferase
MYTKQARGLELVYKTVTGLLIGLSTVILYLFFTRDEFFSRLVLIINFVVSAVLMIGYRTVLDLVFKKRILVISVTSGTERKVEELKFKNAKFKYIRLEEFLERSESGIVNSFDEVLVLEGNGEETLKKIITKCDLINIPVTFVPSEIFVSAAKRSEFSARNNLVLATITRTPIFGYPGTLKRIMDILVSGAALVALSPILLLCILAIKLDGGLKPFYKQKRVGENGNVFYAYKFQTMRPNMEHLKEQLVKEQKNGMFFKVKNDPRVTHVGKILRRTNIDELPQLWNVLRGEMSLVGPRPFIPTEDDTLPKGAVNKRRFVKPGITGLWQVSGGNELPVSELVRLDTYYVENYSIWLDIKIILKTFSVLATRKSN